MQVPANVVSEVTSAIHTDAEIEVASAEAQVTAAKNILDIDVGKDTVVHVPEADDKRFKSALEGLASALNKWHALEPIFSSLFPLCFEGNEVQASNGKAYLKVRTKDWEKAMIKSASAIQKAKADDKEGARDAQALAKTYRERAAATASMAFSRMAKHHLARIQDEAAASGDEDAIAVAALRGTKGKTSIHSKIADMVAYCQKMDPTKVSAEDIKLGIAVLSALRALQVQCDIVAAPAMSASVAAVQNKTHAAPLIVESAEV